MAKIEIVGFISTFIKFCLTDRVKARLSKKIRIRVNYFGLKKRYTEEQLKDDVEELNDEKYDTA